MLYGVGRHAGQDVQTTMPYSEQMKLLRGILPVLPKGKFVLPEEARTPDEALEMFHGIREGRNPLTREGVVIHPEVGIPSKVKPTNEHDVFVRSIFPGEGRLYGHSAGGFDYSRTQDGPVVGRVGTGLSDETRKAMWANRDSYKGRVAKVYAQDQFPSGALRAPSFHAFHEDV